MTSKHIETTLIGAGRGKRYTQGSVNPVTQRASSLVFDSVAAKKHATAQRARRAVLRPTRHADPLRPAGCDGRTGGRRRLRAVPLRRRGGGQCDPVVRRRRRSPAGHGLGVRTDPGFLHPYPRPHERQHHLFRSADRRRHRHADQPNTRVVFLESPAPSPWKCRTFRRWCRPFAP